MADNLVFPCYCRFDGWVGKYISRQMHMASIVFNEPQWNGTFLRTIITCFRTRSSGARDYYGDLSNTVHSEEVMATHVDNEFFRDSCA